MKAANALGGKTARACDSCLRRRARWFCGADDAFLCHSCDNLVHSANQLASRHERVRLQTASSPSNISSTPTHQTWHSGFTRKARTPRHNNNKHVSSQQSKHQQHTEEDEDAVFIHNCLPLVPELGSEDAVVMMEESECLVPDFLDTDFCAIYGTTHQIGDGDNNIMTVKNEEDACDLDNFSEFLESDMDLAEFAADVESLLESGLVVDDESSQQQQLIGCKQEQELREDKSTTTSVVVKKIKDEELQEVGGGGCNENNNNKIFLRLNYEEVISAWDSQGCACPWTTGNPPHLNSADDLGWSTGGDVEGWSYGGRLRGSGREARVTRYREKRRTRLFAKKIRYEVRKLNAEKRPRMKGRFVKRASFLGAPTSTALPPPPPATAAASR
ncbi:Zinc finger protein CONSTANS-LIKE 16 [Senna tora]|uniref:Zinc finger protein CONSTANS-LIKE 16 n=1 Tax=Senna tora TaxID=362788 RepID=A0A834TCV9_9FABA|nr:Zinc finger protein CONSTANS-LIKE 16 [Senna tora]